mmetsp:Transcript_13144/g.21087  ORF Transcript_13144/g.21087 Transcript_13144/m.21087 type:complete len:161 (+) Transcript_13144:99-581(+)
MARSISKFNIWDIRGGGGSGGPVVANGNHEAGVTVIAPHPSYEHVLATGSYDEKVRVYDKRNFYRPLSTFETGGGVWRLRWNKSSGFEDRLLTACMRADFQILNFSKEKSDFKLLCRYEEHGAPDVTKLAYGCDWGYKDPCLVGSCSFYDKQLHLWSIVK